MTLALRIARSLGLYDRARKLGVRGRSSMAKKEPAHVIARAQKRAA